MAGHGSILIPRAEYRERVRAAAFACFAVAAVAGLSMAGLPLSFYNDCLGSSSLRIIRVMPNTPALVLAGASAISGNPNATAKDLQKALDIFFDFNGLRNKRAEHFQTFPDNGDQLDRLSVALLLPAEGEDLPDEGAGLVVELDVALDGLPGRAQLLHDARADARRRDVRLHGHA